MYNLGDDSELDRLSREAAGRYETPGNANWQALSEELDKVMPQEKKRRFLLWWLLPVLLAGGALTYGIINRENKNIASSEKNIPAFSTDKTAEQATTLNNNKSTGSDIAATDKTDKQTEISTEKAITAPQVKENTKSSLNESNLNGSSFSSVKGRNNKVLANHKAVVKSIDKTETGVITAESAVVIPEPTKTAEQPPVIKEQKEITKENIAADQPQQPVTAAPAKTETPTVESPANNDEKKTVQKISLPARGKGWSFALLTGLDKSTVKFTYGYTPGFNLGMEVAYHFNDTWAIRTAGIFTQKKYKIAGEDFTAPKGTPISYFKLDQVEGSCHMWEIPLLVSYTISRNGKKSVTLNTGLSSYFMTHEDYDYYYPYNGVPTTKSASYNSTDTHILSVAHLSAGFENRLSNTLSLQVEPYAKIPLGGVGFGNIKLSSFGVNLSVQYRQPHKK